MNDKKQEANAEIEAIKVDKRRAYHRGYYRQNRERIKEQRLRHAAEVYLERLGQRQTV